MQKNQENPLVLAILQVLRQSQKHLAIHELLQEVKTIARIPVLDDDAQLALFKLNWLMMNALYQLQLELVDEGYLLHISTLDIHLGPLPQNLRDSASQAMSQQPLRDYYLDWQHFSNTTKEEVSAMLDGVWQEYISGDQQRDACALLGVDNAADFALIRKSYRKLATQHHPDKGGDPARFMEIREAYELLRQARA